MLDDGETAWGRAVAVLLVSCAVGLGAPACAADASGPQLTFVAAHKAYDHHSGFLEPSGLSWNQDETALMSVSDDTSRLFSLSAKGDVHDAIRIEKGLDDLEGVTWDAARARFLVVRERSSEIIEVDPLQPDKPVHHRLDAMEGFDAIAAVFSGGSANKGLEGITVVPAAGEIWVVKENDPRLLIRLDAGLTRIAGVLRLTAAMGFVDDSVDDRTLDVSGLSYDATREKVWITSDTGRRVFLFDPVAERASGYRLLWLDEGKRRELHHAEGVAVSADGQRLFVISDDGHDSRIVEYGLEDNS